MSLLGHGWRTSAAGLGLVGLIGLGVRSFVAVPVRDGDADGAAIAATAERSRPGIRLPVDARRALLQQLGLGRTDL